MSLPTLMPLRVMIPVSGPQFLQVKTDTVIWGRGIEGDDSGIKGSKVPK